MLKRYLRSLLVPLGIYFVASLAAYGSLAPTVTVKWNGQRLLERADLRDAPTRSLLLLHSQPPALNTLLAVCLQTSKATGMPVKSVITTVLTIVSAASILLLYWLVTAFTKSQAFGIAAVCLAALDPGFQFFRSLFLGGILVYFWIVALLFLAFKALDSGDRRFLAAAVLVVPLLPNTKSVFHPVWALMVVLLLVVSFTKLHRKSLFIRPWQVALTSIGFLLLLFAWPAKNVYLFDSFTFSSWSGTNLARGTPARSKALNRYLRGGSVTAEIRADIERFRDRFGNRQLHILARSTRSNGARNLNHYAFLSTEAELHRKALRFRMRNLDWWWQNSLINYRNWTRATFFHPYSGEIRGPWTGTFQKYVHAVRETFFADFGFLVRRSLGPPETAASKQQAKLLEGRWTFYGLFVIPLLLILASVVMVRDLVRGFHAGTGVLILSLFTLCWHLAVVCLTDGEEGNRMRFGVTPCSLLLAIYLVSRGWSALKARRMRLTTVQI